MEEVEEVEIKNSAYIPEWMAKNVEGINYRLNTTYQIKDDLRQWNRVNVKYVERHTNQGIYNTLEDEDGDYIYFYSKEMPHL